MLDRILWVTGWVNVILYGLLVREMWHLWHAPIVEDVPRIATLSLLMGFEFILVHSGVFMSGFDRKVTLLILVPFYGVFALIMNSLLPGNAVLYLYMAIVFVRMRFAITNKSKKQMQQALGMSVIAVTIYFFLMMGFTFGSGLIPENGLTSTFLQASGYRDYTSSTGGLWIDEPKIPLAMGVTYFSLLIMVDLLFYGYFPWKFRKNRADL